ncbi:MAG: hypothetical protein LBH01_02140 [Verrucomicrobiales bacterium]|jgi:hypothetical protein|nr:hypothetical protein [Verrucomicrobiales bacterium]
MLTSKWRINKKTCDRTREILNPPRVSPDALSPRELAKYRLARHGSAALLAGLKAKAAAISADIVKAAASRGWNISHLGPELAEEAAGGMGLKIAELGLGSGVLLDMTARQRIPAEVNAAGYRTAQNALRRMAHTNTEQLTGWHESMIYEDHPGKDELTAALDHAAAVLRRQKILARARQLIAAARQYAATSTDRQRNANLSTDLRRIMEATRYMLSLVANSSATLAAKGNRHHWRDWNATARRCGMSLAQLIA